VKKQTKTEELAFEQAFAQLEEIVGKLEAGDLQLDDALALYEQGQRLAAYCSARLDEAELQVQKLATSGAVEPFELDEAR
jgi:exodeoxyribonuclease VII small subunit